MQYVKMVCFILITSLLCITIGLGRLLPQKADAASTTAASEMSPSPSQVKRIINEVFGARYASAARSVAYCESRFDPKAHNRSSGAAGVFQFLLSTWRTTSQKHHSRFNARANILAAYEVFVRDGHSWREWQCQP